MTHYFDTSDYSKDHPSYSAINKTALEKMKDECASVPPSEFAGIRSKIYWRMDMTPWRMASTR